VKPSHRISVLGREIQVKSAASAESVREVETYLNERAAEVALSLPNADQQLIALLVLLNTTESYLALRRGDVSTGDRFQDALESMVVKIDKALGEETPRRVNI
jgi:cell division protein ZapA